MQKNHLSVGFLALVMGLALAATSCGGSGKTVPGDEDWLFADSGDAKAPDSATDGYHPGDSDSSNDQNSKDVEKETDTGPTPGGLNWPCEKNSECDSKYCLDLGDHKVCTVLCDESDCPAFWVCKSAIDTFPTPDQLCVPDTGRRCSSCELDTDCAPQGDRCLPFGEGLGLGLWCFQDCSVDGSCPAGYGCKEVKDSLSGLFKGRFCVPNNNSCFCSPEMEKETRECVRKNQWGECKGEEICMGNLGWVDCSAPLPSVEYCDTKDNDCDGQVDEEYSVKLRDGTTYAMGESCSVGACTGGTVVCKNLSEAMCSAVTQGKAEQCNGIDDDCDGVVDEYVIKTFYKDLDGDGFATINDDTTSGCEPPEGYSQYTNDCNEGDPEVAGGLPELCDYKDNNCNEVIDEGLIYALPNQLPLPIGAPCGLGLCGDGVVICEDKTTLTCSSTINAVPELCNNLDDDCDGVVDNGCDDDNDGYCDISMVTVGKPNTCMLTGADCNDDDKLIHPGRPEYCNGKDDNCDALVDVEVIDCSADSCTGSGNAYMETVSAECIDGHCQAPGAIPCGNYQCEDFGGPGKHCLSSCLFDVQCTPNAHCDEGSGSCVKDVPNSGACVQNSDCVSNYCYNGYCCASGFCCSGPSDCPSQFWATATCQFPPSCQGTRNDAECVDGKCTMGPPIPDDTACDQSYKAKDCGSYAPIYCAGTLDQSEPLCPSWCFDNDQCQSGFHCDQVCVLDLANGSPCDEESDCLSGHCQNSFCCDTGDCCGQAIDCNTLIWAEPSACSDPSNCQGFRRDALCVGARCTKSDPIADDSGCLLAIADTCDAYTNVVCSANIVQIKPPCLTGCTSNAHCDLDAHCEFGKCVSDLNAGEACDTTMDCGDGLFCVEGLCCNSECKGLCRSCALPGFEGTCVNIPAGLDPDAECDEVDCGGFYYGWQGGKCFSRANASAEANTCSGTGQCLPIAQICSTMGPGPVVKDCTGQCEEANPNTCTGTTLPFCQSADTGPVTCGKGACAVTIDGCVDGQVVPCTPGPPGLEICNNIDDNCDGDVDENVPFAEDQYEPNNACNPLVPADVVGEGDTWTVYTATIFPKGDVDYYHILADEADHTCFPLFAQEYTLEVKVVPPQGVNCRDYDLYLYSSDCLLLKASTAASCLSDTVKYTWSGTCVMDDSMQVIVKVVPWLSANDCYPYTLSIRMTAL